MHERHEGVLLWRSSRDDADRFDVRVPGDAGKREPTLRGRASERGVVVDVVRKKVWEARASSIRCNSSKAARASGLVRAILLLGV